MGSPVHFPMDLRLGQALQQEVLWQHCRLCLPSPASHSQAWLEKHGRVSCKRCVVMQDHTLRPSLRDIDEELAHLLAEQSAVNETLADKRQKDQALLEQMLPPQVQSLGHT